MAPPLLMDELVQEVLIRLPPDDPASLVRATLVCLRWRRLVSYAGFRRRFREFHRTVPILGFVYYTKDAVSTFSRATSSCCPPIPDHGRLLVTDARHGRVLLSNPMCWLGYPKTTALIVWNPITEEQWALPMMPAMSPDPHGWNVSIICANYSTCDHRDCSRGPFLVVLVATLSNGISVYTYSSEAGAWSKKPAATAWHPVDEEIDWHWHSNSALVLNTLYVKFRYSKSIMEFNLATREISVVDLPASCHNGRTTLMTSESGGLGFTHAKHTKIYLWSRDASTPDGFAVWTQSRVIDLKTLLPASDYTVFDVVSFVDGVAFIVARTR